MLHPLTLTQLTTQSRTGAVRYETRRWRAIRRRFRRLVHRPSRRLTSDDAGLAPGVVDARGAELAAACRDALEALEHGGDTRAAEQALRAVARLDAVVTTRTNRAPAACGAPNCAGHRTRA